MNHKFDMSAPDNISEEASIVDILQWRARMEHIRVGYTYLADGETEEIDLTYGELDRRARRIAAELQQMGAAGERALLIYPPGLDFIIAFYGCLYAGATAIPVPPPRPRRSLESIQNIAADSQAAFALTTSALQDKFGEHFAEDSRFRNLQWVVADSSISDNVVDWRPSPIDKHTLALIQYTSGSTTAPKGVMASHDNILHNQRLIQQSFGQSAQSVIVSWLPHYHDMGLIGAIIQPLFIGARCVLMAPTSFLQSPIRWLQAISRFQATTSGGPNFAYDLCVRRITGRQMASLDLRLWRTAFNGAEPIRAESLDQFAGRFAEAGFRREALTPCYGLAESTLLVSASGVGEGPRIRKFSADGLQRQMGMPIDKGETADGLAPGEKTRSLVGCGRIPASGEAVIANPRTLTRCGPNEIGEIWLKSSSVAQGYWGRPIETMEIFNARLADSGDGPYLRTGDLGLIVDGELYITGRCKDLIVVRGRNHYPQDIELTVESSCEGVRPGGGVAFSFDEDGIERLAVVQEVERSFERQAAAMIGKIRTAIAEAHEIEVSAVTLVKAGGVPRTTSGKVQRQTCRRQFLEQSLEGVIHQWNITESERSEELFPLNADDPDSDGETLSDAGSIERWLRRAIARRLGIHPEDIGVDEPLARYGVDSLNAMELGHELERRLGVVISPSTWMAGPGVALLAAEAYKLAQTAELRTPPKEAANGRSENEFTLSYGQLAFWYGQQIAPESSAYNLACVARLSARLDAPAFSRALQALVDRHAALRTSFALRQGEPIQLISPQCEPDFLEEDASKWDEAALKKRVNEEAYLPFSLERGPILRVRLYRKSSDDFVLLLAAHHIIADFWSMAVVMKELGVFYDKEIGVESRKLNPLLSSYGDYVSWQRRFVESAEGERHWNYWKERLGDELPVLRLPTDKSRPAIQTSRGKSQPFFLDAELTRRLKTLSQRQNATLYQTMLSAFLALLHRCAGQNEILISAPTAGRNTAEWDGLTGYFVNPVIIRSRYSERASFQAFLESVVVESRAAFEHQDYPYALLVERLQGKRELSQSPLAQAMFVMQKAQTGSDQNLTALVLNEPGVIVDLGTLRLETMSLEKQATQFDVTLMIAERDGGISGALKYNFDLFDPSAISRLVSLYRNLAKALVDDPERRVSQAPFLDEAERRQILVKWNRTQLELPPHETISSMFEERARLDPDSIAAEFENVQLTFEGLNLRANQLAHYLKSIGVGLESRIGILLPRSIDMMIAALGILKAGGAYLPLDISHPEDRVAYMLEDSGVQALLTRGEPVERLYGSKVHIINLDLDWGAIAAQRCDDPVQETTSGNLAYIIYTSGSTGRPKGVMIRHRSALNLAAALQRGVYSDCGGRKLRIAMNSPFVFDASVKQMLMTFVGHSVHIIPDHARRDSVALLSYIQQKNIDVFDCTPSQLELLIMAGLIHQIQDSPMMYLIGGEPINEQLWNTLAAVDEATFFNLYGPTEFTVDAVVCKLSSATARPVIGRPLANTRIYLLDKALQPVPIGVPGELHIVGKGAARGYLNLPELTADKFIPNPFDAELGDRLYKTGDLAQYLPDGNIAHLGRLDLQVKIRGFRIELEEIESALRNCGLVQDAVVSVIENEISGKRLVAYVTAAANESLSIAELQQRLKKLLPDYMIPSAFITLDAFPLTSNGKINRGALPALEEFQSPLDGAGFVAPRTLVEEWLADRWAQLLGLAEVGVFDNFFELGGHSLMATQLISQLQDVFTTEVPLLSLFFENPTVAGLAEVLLQSRNGDGDAEDLIQTLESISHLMEEDMETILVTG